MYQFFVETTQITEDQIRILGKDVNHMKNVLRMKPGEEIRVTDSETSKSYRCEVAELYEETVVCHILAEEEEGSELPVRIYLFQGLPKADKMELIIQKAVELGVYQIIPTACRRCVVKLDPKKEKTKLARWQQIAEAAAKQSKRSLIPEIMPVISLREAFARSQKMQVRLIPYERAEGMEKTREILKGIRPGDEVAVFIGPEGGFEEAEIEEAMKAGNLGGFPVVGVHATVYDGSYHEVDSSEMAFHIAGSMCFKEAMKKAQPVLLEPVMKVEVTMPEEYMGDVIGDMNSRRGRVTGMEDIGGGKQVNGFVPLAQMFGYATDLRSMTQGRGNYSMFFEKYEPVPKNIAEKVLNDAGKTQA